MLALIIFLVQIHSLMRRAGMAILLLIDYQQFARDNDENTVAAEVKQLRQRLQSKVFVAMNKVR